MYAPIRFNNFEVGPYSVTMQPLLFPSDDGDTRETFGEMSKRAHDLLTELFDMEFERQLNSFLDRLEKMGEIVKARRA